MAQRPIHYKEINLLVLLVLKELCSYHVTRYYILAIIYYVACTATTTASQSVKFRCKDFQCSQLVIVVNKF